MLPVCIFPFPIIYWFWSLMAELRWSLSHSYEWTISLSLWGMAMSNKHKCMKPGEVLTVPHPETLLISPTVLLSPRPSLGERWGWRLPAEHGTQCRGDLAGQGWALPLKQRVRLNNKMLVRLLICPLHVFTVLFTFSPLIISTFKILGICHSISLVFFLKYCLP